MLKNNIKIVKRILAALMLLALASQPAFAQSLYEQYASATKADLEPETKEMGKQLTKTFNSSAINRKSRQIDFAKYYSNLRKLVAYGNKLAAYSEYEKDLTFARDNEIFKGLPEQAADIDNHTFESEKKQFVEEKYTRMKKNVGEEIDTYEDLILLSLDVCEYLTEYDLVELTGDPEYSRKIQSLKNSEEYGVFRMKKDRLAAGWPELERRISAQFSLWGPKPASQDDPIINPSVTGAL